MTKLDIYDKKEEMPREPRPPSSKSWLSEQLQPVKDVRDALSQSFTSGKEQLRETEAEVLRTIRPVTKYGPLSYERTKEIGLVSLCTLAGLLRGRRYGFIRRKLYPVLGFSIGYSIVNPTHAYSLAQDASEKSVAIGKSTSSQVTWLSQELYNKYQEYSANSPEPVQAVSASLPNQDASIQLPATPHDSKDDKDSDK